MELTDDILATTARLAALDLSPDERASLRDELSHILTYVKLLDAVAVEAESAGPGLGLSQLRPDEPRPGLTRAEAVGQATASDGETFSVPPVLDTP